MLPQSATSVKIWLISLLLCVSACSGGGGSGSSSSLTESAATSNAQEEASATGRMLSFAEDIEPIMQSKCLGCHNSGENPLAPFSLEGIERVNSFKSAIHYAVESQTMPPADSQQLSGSEQAKLMAWLTNTPFNYVPEILRIALAEPLAWDTQSKIRDVFLDHRPDEVDCARDTGWLVESDVLEVRTEFCNYLSLTQESLLDLPSSTEMELSLSHSALNFNANATAHVAVSIAGNTIWETTIGIPSDSNILKEKMVLPFAVSRGDAIEIHLHNHGDNAWTVHSLDTFISSDEELDYCPSFESTFEAIQATVFEQAGCANSLCHGDAKAGGLDLTPLNAYDNIVTAPSEGSSLSLVEPRNPAQSYLYHKLSAKTFPDSYPIDGSPMPSAGGAISPGQLEAIRLWIEAGAPRDGSVGDTLGRGEDEIERLLGVCLPEAEAVNTVPLTPPEPDKGIQLVMPPHDVPAEKERELCFAVYEDFRDVIPPEYLDETGDNFYVKGGKVREDAFTHHNLVYQAPVGVDRIHDPSFGGWTCAGGDMQGQTCEPTERSSCGAEGQCRSQLEDSVACRGYGPSAEGGSGSILGLGTGIEKEGFYTSYPAHGIFYWNSHAFNLTTEDGIHHVWRNIYFADDRRFKAQGINEIGNILAAYGTQPFAKKTVCRDYIFDQGDGLLALNSHTHKRGERFFMSLPDGEEIYETFTYDEPLYKRFEPAIVFNSGDPAERTLTYCATYNNGVNKDGSPNIETVTRLSRRPTNAGACKPTACVAGKVGASCNGEDDDASCDSTPGEGNGWCDACEIGLGVSSDDEMFILLGSKLADHDALINAYTEPEPEVSITAPSANDVFTAGDVINLEFAFKHFELMPPENHNQDACFGEFCETTTEHGTMNGEHGGISAGHYHVYLDTDDDSADHVTAWTESLEYTLPDDIPAGAHTLRISLRASDHHAIGVENSLTIQVQ